MSFPLSVLPKRGGDADYSRLPGPGPDEADAGAAPSGPSLSLGGAARTRSRNRIVWGVGGVLFVLGLFYLGGGSSSRPFRTSGAQSTWPDIAYPSYDPSLGSADGKVGGAASRDLLGASWNLTLDFDRSYQGMSAQECNAAFHPLWEPLVSTVQHYEAKGPGKFSREDLERSCERSSSGHHARVVIGANKHLYVKWFRPINSRVEATLAQIHQALVGMKEDLVPIEFCLGLEDGGQVGAWSLSRKNIPEHDGVWLMPDFGFWSWPEPGVGSYEDIRRDTWSVERKIGSWAGKIPKIFWRGAINPQVGAPDREAMVKAAEGHEWNDIKAMVWGHNDDKTKVPANFETMPDHCKYAFLAHPEGATYSGRLKYMQNCRSVIITHPPQYFQHWTHLYNGNESSPLQNIVILPSESKTEPWDAWRHLPAKMDALMGKERHRAQDIADRSWEAFRQRWISPAATACYWRVLMRSFASVQGYKVELTGEETSYESLMLQGYRLKSEVEIH